MQKEAFNTGLLDFLGASPSPFHATSNLAAILLTNGFTELKETENWQLGPGKYFVTRNQSSIIGFIIGDEDPATTGIRMSGAHTDSPCLKLKPNPEIYQKGYLQLGVEVYGGALLNPWFDRDLSLAGRVTVATTDKNIENLLLDFEIPLAILPSLAIHLDREANNSRSINPQLHLPPVLMRTDGTEKLESLLLSQIGKQYGPVNPEKILGSELSFYDTQKPAFIGFHEEFLASARLDNLLSCYVGIQSLLVAGSKVSTLVVCNDHEEVGSASTSGADGPFLQTLLQRIIPDDESRYRAIARSLMVSTDNAHAVHPNFTDRHDSNHGPELNKGLVIKINANQRYATNSETEGYFSYICQRNDIPFQKFINRTDLACGSTIGPITARQIGVRTLDVGVPTFAMHSIRELAGADDAFHLFAALGHFFTDEGNLGAG